MPHARWIEEQERYRDNDGQKAKMKSDACKHSIFTGFQKLYGLEKLFFLSVDYAKGTSPFVFRSPFVRMVPRSMFVGLRHNALRGARSLPPEMGFANAWRLIS